MRCKQEEGIAFLLSFNVAARIAQRKWIIYYIAILVAAGL